MLGDDGGDEGGAVDGAYRGGHEDGGEDPRDVFHQVPEREAPCPLVLREFLHLRPIGGDRWAGGGGRMFDVLRARRNFD